MYDLAKWKRWIRKRPENRKGSEPTYCKTFVIEAWHWAQYRSNSKGILEAYHSARIPKATEKEVVACMPIEKINALLQEVERYE